MTLATHVIITSPMAPYREVFDFCRGLIGAENAAYSDQENNTWPDEKPTGMWSIANHLGQGYVAYVAVQYHPDGPLRPMYQDDTSPAGFLRITFDTAYGYRADNGANCSDLHAWLIERVAIWCDGTGYGPIWWQNEYTGEWSNTIDNLHTLGNAERGALTSPVRGESMAEFFKRVDKAKAD